MSWMRVGLGKVFLVSGLVGFVLASSASKVEAATYRANKNMANQVYNELQNGLDSGWITKDQMPKESNGSTPNTPDQTQGHGTVSIVRSSDGSWSITISFDGNFRLVGKQADKTKSITVTYNAANNTITASGAAEVGVGWEALIYPSPPVVLKASVGVGASAYTISYGIEGKAYVYGRGGAGLGIPWVNVSGQFTGHPYVRVALQNFRCPATTRAVGLTLTFTCQVQVVIVVWSQDWQLARVETTF